MTVNTEAPQAEAPAVLPLVIIADNLAHDTLDARNLLAALRVTAKSTGAENDGELAEALWGIANALGDAMTSIESEEERLRHMDRCPAEPVAEAPNVTPAETTRSALTDLEVHLLQLWGAASTLLIVAEGLHQIDAETSAALCFIGETALEHANGARAEFRRVHAECHKTEGGSR